LDLDRPGAKLDRVPDFYGPTVGDRGGIDKSSEGEEKDGGFHEHVGRNVLNG